jgi:hypothetical protein
MSMRGWIGWIAVLALSLGGAGDAAAYTAAVVQEDGTVERLEQLVVVVGQKDGRTAVHWRLPGTKGTGARGLIVAVGPRPTTVATKGLEAFDRIEKTTAPRRLAFKKKCSEGGAQEPPARVSRTWSPGRCARCGHRTRVASEMSATAEIVDAKKARAWMKAKGLGVEESAQWRAVAAAAEHFVVAKMEPGHRLEAVFEEGWTVPAPAWEVDLTVIVGREGPRARVVGRPEVALPAQAEVEVGSPVGEGYGQLVGQIWAAEPQAAVIEYAQANRRHRKTQAELGMPSVTTLSRFRVRHGPETGVIMLGVGVGVRGVPQWPTRRAVETRRASKGEPSDFEVGLMELRDVAKVCRSSRSVWEGAGRKAIESTRTVSAAGHTGVLPAGTVRLDTQSEREEAAAETEGSTPVSASEKDGEKEKGCAIAGGKPISLSPVWIAWFVTVRVLRRGRT